MKIALRDRFRLRRGSNEKTFVAFFSEMINSVNILIDLNISDIYRSCSFVTNIIILVNLLIDNEERFACFGFAYGEEMD